MRASDGKLSAPRHLSAAERLIEDQMLNAVVGEMVARAKAKSPNHVQMTLDLVPPGSCHHTRCIPVQTVHVSHSDQASALAAEILIRAGVSPRSALSALAALRNGLGAGGAAMPGASLWDKESGARLEPDQAIGVRSSRFDYSVASVAEIESTLATYGLTNSRMRDALAVATKSIWSGVTADLCWSGEPGYATGYVATSLYGYVRITDFKPMGAAGGRISFVDVSTDTIESYVHRLEKEFLLIEAPVYVQEPISAEEFIDRL